MANKNTNPGGGKPQFLQTSTMPNPHISPNLTSLGRGNVPVARNPIPKPHKRQNQTIRKNNTIPQLNFHSSWGLAPEVLLKITHFQGSNPRCSITVAHFQRYITINYRTFSRVYTPQQPHIFKAA